MRELKIKRKYNALSTNGTLDIIEAPIMMRRLFTVELPWKSNTRRESCIPGGVYQCEKHLSPSKGLCIAVLDVPNRSNILIHVGNYTRDLLGCIAPGLSQADIDGDGIMDVASSRAAMQILLSAMPDRFKLTIQ